MIVVKTRRHRRTADRSAAIRLAAALVIAAAAAITAGSGAQSGPGISPPSAHAAVAAGQAPADNWPSPAR